MSTQVVLVQLLCRVQPFVTPWTAARQTSLSFTISLSLLKLMFIESVMPAIQPSHALLPPSPLVFNFSKHQVAKVLELQLQHQSFQ